MLVHPDRLRPAAPCAARWFVDPMPGDVDKWQLSEDGAFPGDFGLSDALIAELATHCSPLGASVCSQPLRPTAFEPSTHCLVCRQSLRRPAHPRTVQCAFCDAVVHEDCVQYRQRKAVDRPKLYRCSGCVAELPKAMQWVTAHLGRGVDQAKQANSKLMDSLASGSSAS